MHKYRANGLENSEIYRSDSFLNPMKNTIQLWSKKLAAGFATAVVSLATIHNASAIIIAPYTNDVSTIHLYHLDDSVAPAIDSATGGTSMASLLSGATLGNASYSGFGTALNTVDGGQDATAAGTRDARLAAPSGSVGPYTYANSTNGAFTYEAVVWIGFDPTKNHEGFGLQGMRERAEEMGGQFSIESSEGNGTVISIVLPLTSSPDSERL